jgi:hypothetical protein
MTDQWRMIRSMALFAVILLLVGTACGNGDDGLQLLPAYGYSTC